MLAAGCGGNESERDEPARQEPLIGVTGGALSAAPQLLAAELEVMARTGVTTLRLPFYWRAIEPSEGSTDFAATDVLVRAAARRDIALLPVVLGTPAWAARKPASYNSPPADVASYAAFMRVLIRRYGPAGSFWAEHPRLPKRPLRDWQLWNEPDHLRYWSEQPHAADYVRLAQAARRAIKRADPGARVVMAGYADRLWDSVAAIYRAGGEGVFDVVAIHPYTFEPSNVLRAVELARAALREAGDARRPLWLTEVTWSSGRRPGVEPYPFETTERDQAARLAEVYPLLLDNRRRLGIERIYWESWLTTDRDHRNPFNFSGLRALAPDGTVTEKPAFEAFRRAAAEAG